MTSPRLPDRRFTAILLLGFGSGLPLALVSSTLKFWLSEAHVSLGNIGLFGLVMLPYTLKFLWAPVLDQVRLPLLGRLGRRRGWGLLFQALLALAICALALCGPAMPAHPTDLPPPVPLRPLAVLTVLAAILSASQDIVIDALRIEMLQPPQYGTGAATSILGYRIGMLASGAGALYIAAFASWQAAYAAMAVLLGLGALGFLLAPDTQLPAMPGLSFAQRFRHAVIDPLLDLLRHARWPVIAAFVLLYKLAPAMATAMNSPFYVAMGFSKPEVASITKVFGIAALIAGGFGGGWLVQRQGIWRALMIGGALQAACLLGFEAVALTGHDLAMLTLAIGAENFTSAMASIAFVAYLSGLCNRAYTATQYALLYAVASFATDGLASASGYLAHALGWPLFYGLSPLLALPGLGVLIALRKLDFQDKRSYIK